MLRGARWAFGVKIVLFGLALGAVTARADAAALESCVARLDDARVAQLLAFSEASLAEQRLGSSLWFAGWSAFNATNVAVGLWQMQVVDTQIARDGWMLAAIGAGGFLVGAWLLPPPALMASRRLGRESAASPAQRREKLRHALSLLERAAAFETRNTSWVTHAGGVFYGVLSVGYMYLHNLHAEDMSEVHLRTWVQFGATVVGAEATIWSVPRKARRDVATIQRRFCPEPRAPARRAWSMDSLSLQVAGTQLGLRLRF